jgi:hypothetical protein
MFYPIYEKMGSYTHRWPSGEIVTYENSAFFTVKIGEEKISVIVAFKETEKFGRIRKRAVVFVKGSAIIEFTSTDNYDKTGDLLGPLKKPKVEEMFSLNESVPNAFTRFRIVYHKDYIKNGFDRLGILVNCSDLYTMINYALTRAQMEGTI